MSIHRSRPWSGFALLLAFVAAGCGPTDGTESLEPVGSVEQPVEATAVSLEIIASRDTRVQGPSSTDPLGGGALYTNTPAHLSFVGFDLSALPANATLQSAEFKVYFTGNGAGQNGTELGRVENDWDENLISSDPMTVTWSGQVQPVGEVEGYLVYDVKNLVEKWRKGERPNHGFALRSTSNGSKQYHSKETSNIHQPRLVINYTIPTPIGQRIDLGDAPDSTSNTHYVAYATVGTLGYFPTVWNVGAGEVAGPRHANKSMQAFLGQTITHETEADRGTDADASNNLIPYADKGGADAGRDGGDDGWENRQLTFPNCGTETLKVRVSRPPTSTVQQMYLNVWRDGNRDGDWEDVGLCSDNGRSHEWIVQDHVIDMLRIPLGGSSVFEIPTARVMNQFPGSGQWMRFTLADRRAPSAPGRAPDGRGPHPTVLPLGFPYGETEDYLHALPPPPRGGSGRLEVEQRTVLTSEPIFEGNLVTYEIVARHVGGSRPVQASFATSLAPFRWEAEDGGPEYAFNIGAPVTTEGVVVGDITAQGATQRILWGATIPPNGELELRFTSGLLDLPECAPLAETTTVQAATVAHADGYDTVEGGTSVLVDCEGEVASQPGPGAAGSPRP